MPKTSLIIFCRSFCTQILQTLFPIKVSIHSCPPLGVIYPCFKFLIRKLNEPLENEVCTRPIYVGQPNQQLGNISFQRSIRLSDDNSGRIIPNVFPCEGSDQEFYTWYAGGHIRRKNPYRLFLCVRAAFTSVQVLKVIKY